MEGWCDGVHAEAGQIDVRGLLDCGVRTAALLKLRRRPVEQAALLVSARKAVTMLYATLGRDDEVFRFVPFRMSLLQLLVRAGATRADAEAWLAEAPQAAL